MEHEALHLLTRNGERALWVLSRGTARWEGIPPGRVAANSPEMLLRLAHQGAGIAIASNMFVEPYVRSGELVRVLADWTLPEVTAWAVFPGRRLMPARTRVFLDAMQATCASPDCQSRG